MTEEPQPGGVGKPKLGEIELRQPADAEKTSEFTSIKVEVDSGRTMNFSVIFGDITEAPVDAIVCPSSEKMDVGFSPGVTGAIRRVAGVEPFESAGRLIKELNTETDTEGLRFAESVGIPAGEVLESRGIKNIVFTNVYPKGERLGVDGLSDCVTSAVLEASSKGAKSIGVPAIGSGTFGALSLKDSCIGVLKGLAGYARITKDKTSEYPLEYVALVLYHNATPENVSSLRDMLLEINEESKGQIEG